MLICRDAFFPGCSVACGVVCSTSVPSSARAFVLMLCCLVGDINVSNTFSQTSRFFVVVLFNIIFCLM